MNPSVGWVLQGTHAVGWGCWENGGRVRAYRTHPTYGLRLAEMDDIKMGETEITFSDLENELAKIDNPIIRSIIRDVVYSFTPDSLKQSLRELVSNKIQHSKRNYKCICKNCNNNAIDSHELSKKQMEKSIARADKDGKFIVRILNPNLSDGIPKFILTEKSTKKATVFKGYCKEHDASLFSTLDSLVDPDNYQVIKRQFLRTIASKISQLRLEKSCIEECFKELSIEKEKTNSDKGFNDALKKIEDKIQIYNQEIQYFQELHNNFFEKENIKIKRYQINNVNFIGSIVLGKEATKENIFIYIAKYNNKFYLYLGYWGLEKDDSSNFFKDFDLSNLSKSDGRINDATILLAEMILYNKDQLIFGYSFELAELENTLCAPITVNKYNILELYFFANRIFF